MNEGKFVSKQIALAILAVSATNAAPAKTCLLGAIDNSNYSTLNLAPTDWGVMVQWHVTLNGQKFPIMGQAACTNASAASCGAVGNYSSCANNQCRCATGQVPGVTNYGANCWCKMRTPVEGHWAFFTANASYADCFAYCAMHCAAHVWSTPAFRSAVFAPM